MMQKLLGIVLLLSLALHAATKGPARLPEMLWACHVASVFIAVGVLTGLVRLTAAGLLFHVAVGMPGYVLDILASHSTTPTSVLVHILPIIVAVTHLQTAGYPRHVVGPTLAAFVGLVAYCRGCADANLNVNMAHATWSPLAHWLPVWASWLLNLSLAATLLFIADIALRRAFTRVRPNTM